MNETYLYLLVLLGIFIGIICISLIIFHFKRKKIIKKVKLMSANDKADILNRLCEPFGFIYDPVQDIFSTRLSPVQKLFGYNAFYDASAPFFNMIFDYETIYFNYGSRTWLIQMWKGQYGINSGCELGIYYADEIISPEDYNSTTFRAVDSTDMLNIYLKLNEPVTIKNVRRYFSLGHLRRRHWWLTIFKMGIFNKPSDLLVSTSITFKDYSMMRCFLESFRTTLPDTPYRVNGLTVCFTFGNSERTYSVFRRFIRKMALIFCRLYCFLFNFITRPFEASGDKLLYLYYYLPVFIRFIFKK